MAEFAEVPGDDDEGYSTPKAAGDTPEDRFKDISDDKLSDICNGNFKEYCENDTLALDTFKDALKTGVTKSQLIFCLLFKLFDNDEEHVAKFGNYLTEVIKELGLEKEDFTEGLSQFNEELCFLHWDLPHVDTQYSAILYNLAEEGDYVDFRKLKWYNDQEGEPEAEISFKLLIRIAERKFIESEHDHQELTEYIEKHGLKEVNQSILDYLGEDLLQDYQEDVKSHELIYKELGFP